MNEYISIACAFLVGGVIGGVILFVFCKIRNKVKAKPESFKYIPVEADYEQAVESKRNTHYLECDCSAFDHTIRLMYYGRCFDNHLYIEVQPNPPSGFFNKIVTFYRYCNYSWNSMDSMTGPHQILELQKFLAQYQLECTQAREKALQTIQEREDENNGNG